MIKWELEAAKKGKEKEEVKYLSYITYEEMAKQLAELYANTSDDSEDIDRYCATLRTMSNEELSEEYREFIGEMGKKAEGQSKWVLILEDIPYTGEFGGASYNDAQTGKEGSAIIDLYYNPELEQFKEIGEYGIDSETGEGGVTDERYFSVNELNPKEKYGEADGDEIEIRMGEMEDKGVLPSDYRKKAESDRGVTQIGADKEETPPAAYQTYKIKPKDVEVPPSVEPGSKTVESLLQVVHKAEESKTNLQVAIEKATQEIEKAMNLGDIDRKEQEALDQLATLLDAQKDKIVSIGSWLVALRDQIKVKKGKLTPSEKVNKLIEKFEGAEQFLKNVEAQVKDEQTRIREIVEFPKKESSLHKMAGVGGWFKGLLDKMSEWLDDLISAEGLLEDADQILEGV